MYESARQLVPEQRFAFDIIIAYCKDLRKSLYSNSQKPKPPLLKVHGGAGSGKSKLIQDISSWAEYYLRTNNDRHPDHPFIIKVAPTGKAASIIQGLTLHSAFNFRFGNDYFSLPDRQRENMRNLMSQLRIVIIDEISMVKPDLLNQLNLRLQEIKQNKDDFGGVSVILFGDLMQLSPVMANWIFEAPKSKQSNLSHLARPIWNSFNAIELKQNHRQGNDKSYAELLNRVRYGKQTQRDLEVLSSRVRNDYPENSLFVYGTKKPVLNQNKEELNKLATPLFTLSAMNIHPNKKSFKPHVSKDGTVNDTPFRDELDLKKGARIMLTYNIDTADGLTNGSTGIVIDFIVRDNIVQYVVIELDEKGDGANLRAKLRHIVNRYQNKAVTPIGRVSFEYSLGRSVKQHTAKAKVIQFPLTLAWATTAHKIQGQTIKKPNTLVADIKSVFEAGQAYVILGRVQDINQLYLRNFVPEKIMVSSKAMKEAENINKIALNNKETLWTCQDATLRKISSLNIRSLQKHYRDLQVDSVMLQSDIICINETFLKPNTLAPIIEGYNCHLASKGNSSGVAVYIKSHLNSLVKATTLIQPSFQAVKVSIRNQFDVIAVYRSPNDKSLINFTNQITAAIHSSHPTIICGDVNIDYLKTPQNPFSTALQEIGFRQIINKPTHIQGSLLDHFYIRFDNCSTNQRLHHPYYSDHDAICVILKKTLQKLNISQL